MNLRQKISPGSIPNSKMIGNVTAASEHLYQVSTLVAGDPPLEPPQNHSGSCSKMSNHKEPPGTTSSPTPEPPQTSLPNLPEPAQNPHFAAPEHPGTTWNLDGKLHRTLPGLKPPSLPCWGINCLRWMCVSKSQFDNP